MSCRWILAAAAALLSCAPPHTVTPPRAEAVCDLPRWRALRPAAAWSDSLVAEADLDSGLMRLSTPTLRHGPPPEGWAVVGVVVMPEGLVADAKIMASSSPAVDSLARWLALESRFGGPRRGGRSVWAFACVPVVFTIRY